MWPDLVSIPGPLTYELSALPTALRDPASRVGNSKANCTTCMWPSFEFLSEILYQQI